MHDLIILVNYREYLYGTSSGNFMKYMRSINQSNNFVILSVSFLLLFCLLINNSLAFKASSSTENNNSYSSSVQDDTRVSYSSFISKLDLFVESEPMGYGVYKEKQNPTFNPGEDIILYIEPEGFSYGKTINKKGESLNSIDFVADFKILDTERNILSGQQNLPVSDIVSHHQNKEVFIPFTITQESPFTPGNYIIIYTIHDENSRKSFDIEKEITIS